jgi:hypothetical protein
VGAAVGVRRAAVEVPENAQKEANPYQDQIWRALDKQ